MKNDRSHYDTERAIAACYSTWADDYFERYYQSPDQYPPVHADLVFDVLRSAGVRCVLDAGCGPASFLRHVGSDAIEWHGFDVTPEMVDEAQRVVAELGNERSLVWKGSVLDDAAFTAPQAGVTFDGAIAIGVLPHVPVDEDEGVLRRMMGAVEPGGTLVAEARNELFALFSLNRPTLELFGRRLTCIEDLRAHASERDQVALDGIEQALASHVRMDLPPVRTGRAGEQGYDEVLSRTHVPFELQAAARRAGWVDVELLYVHYHVLPPMFECLIPDLYRSASLAMEDPRDWRGMVMASAFLVIGSRPA